MSPTLPAVLQRPNGNSLSMERALKQILHILEHCAVDTPELEHMTMVSIDDVQEMLLTIDRG